MTYFLPDCQKLRNVRSFRYPANFFGLCLEFSFLFFPLQSLSIPQKEYFPRYSQALSQASFREQGYSLFQAKIFTMKTTAKTGRKAFLCRKAAFAPGLFFGKRRDSRSAAAPCFLLRYLIRPIPAGSFPPALRQNAPEYCPYRPSWYQWQRSRSPYPPIPWESDIPPAAFA